MDLQAAAVQKHLPELLSVVVENINQGGDFSEKYNEIINLMEQELQ